MTYILNLDKYIKYTQAHRSIRTFGRIYYIILYGTFWNFISAVITPDYHDYIV